MKPSEEFQKSSEKDPLFQDIQKQPQNSQKNNQQSQYGEFNNIQSRDQHLNNNTYQNRQNQNYNQSGTIASQQQFQQYQNNSGQFENQSINMSTLSYFQKPDFRFPETDFHIKSRRTLKVAEKQFKNNFKVMSYNVLSDAIVNEDLRKNDPEYLNNQYLNWIDRGNRILKEIQYYDPDILALQEFDEDEKIMNENLLNSGYQKVYLTRGNGKKDGSGIFFKINRFEQVEYLVLNMFQQQLHDSLLDRPNVAVFVLLKDKLSSELILVINCHILFNEKRGDIKLLQIQMIQSAIKQIQLSVQRNFSLIWCGDFNFIPKSPMYTYMSQGFFDFDNVNFRKLSCQRDCFYSKTDMDLNQVFYKLSLNSNKFYQKFIQYEPKSREYKDWYELFHQIKINRNINSMATVEKNSERQVQNDYSLEIKLISSYAKIQETCFNSLNRSKEKYMKYTTFEPIITTLGKTTIGTVDYIWYSNTFNNQKIEIHPISVVEAPSSTDLMKFQNFPNYNFPSDHIPLIVEFGFRQKM